RGNKHIALRPEDVTVAELLKTAGYQTGLIGKWSLGPPQTTGTPNRQGFDYFFGYENQGQAHNYYPAYLWRNDKKVPLKNVVEKNIGGKDGKQPVAGGIATKRVEYSHDLFVKDALQFIQTNKNRPFFLYLALTIPHANNEVKCRGAKELDIPEYRGMEVPDFGPYADRDWPGPQKGHAAMITRMDADVGRILDELKKLGIDEKTVVFFSSDNGPHKEGGADPKFFKSAGKLRGYKRSLHDGGIRMPMIVRWPDHIPADTVSDLPCAFWDFLPTACELAGVETPKKVDGLSLVPTLLGHPDKQPRHEYLYWEFHKNSKKTPVAQAVRMEHWKAVRLDPAGPIRLYDLRTDLGEEHDVAAQHPDVVAKIREHLQSARTDSKDWPLFRNKKK
ncbi:MAG: arylsulfatase, partial [Planctomycetia bacterium]